MNGEDFTTTFAVKQMPAGRGRPNQKCSTEQPV